MKHYGFGLEMKPDDDRAQHRLPQNQAERRKAGTQERRDLLPSSPCHDGERPEQDDEEARHHSVGRLDDHGAGYLAGAVRPVVTAAEARLRCAHQPADADKQESRGGGRKSELPDPVHEATMLPARRISDAGLGLRT